MQLVHIPTSPPIVVLLDERLNIVRVWRRQSGKKLPNVVLRAHGLIASPFDGPRWIDRYFQTDGLGAIRLLFWIDRQYPDASAKVNYGRLIRLFHSDPTDALKAAMRVYCGVEHHAGGESSYFISQLRTHHPAEIAAIAALGEIARRGIVSADQPAMQIS